MLSCRVIVDLARDGALNMALDEALAESVAQTGQAVLRFYTWAVPTLSLGYFQAAADRVQHAASHGCPTVRRASGGGAILHDDELTYSLALPAPAGAVGDAPQHYQDVHGALLAALTNWRIQAITRPRTEKPPAGVAEPFLCFQRKALGDVLIGAVKICGSAQRRRRGVLLQHGSVLLGRSAAAPELPGLRELCDTTITPAELQQAWLPELRTRLSLADKASEVTPAELADGARLAQEKYAAPEWTLRR